MKGVVIGGSLGGVQLREKGGERFELGELLVADGSPRMLLQVVDLAYGFQFGQQEVELLSGVKLEEGSDLGLFDEQLRVYTLARAKVVVALGSRVSHSRVLPAFFSDVHSVTKDDLSFLSLPENAVFFGMVRSGSQVLDVPVFLDGKKVLEHHVLVTGTTGRGKSVFLSTLLWELVKAEWCGVLVLDPHDEYYGRSRIGLKDHPLRERVVYYSLDDIPPGGRSLKIHISSLLPQHFDGVIDWSDAQRECITLYYRRNPSGWIRDILDDVVVEDVHIHEATLGVVKRRLLGALQMVLHPGGVECRGAFDLVQGESTVREIVALLRSGHVVILDSSKLAGRSELLVGSVVASEVLRAARAGEHREHRMVSILVEEAPRVLGQEVLERGSNVFASIAREGRKFGVGLIAATQLPSLIPRQILANINTKIIFGTEMKLERAAMIESASQDLSDDDRMIASLERGEAIISSNFSHFAIPVKFPLFEEFALREKQSGIQRRLFGV